MLSTRHRGGQAGKGRPRSSPEEPRYTEERGLQTSNRDPLQVPGQGWEVTQGVLGKGDSAHSRGQWGGRFEGPFCGTGRVLTERWREGSDGWQGCRKLLLGVHSDLS